MSNSAYQAIEIESHRPVGQARHSIQFARSDARKHLSETGKHCIVCEIKVVWTTSTLADLNIEA